eukprot:TRINITY_DN2585_c0_g1_i1.p1 TRINITY_DN2585_c0_g1~~TRINITY_DN2585_c0_g1_i1.p1  ORF type:complete len:476 (-),score=69.28 TRINITY_DN2585_c0_g1_i1:73-1500(-)
MHLLDWPFICCLALVGLAWGQSDCSNGDYRLSIEGTTAFSLSKDDLVCRCPAGIETNGAVRAASFEVSGANLTGPPTALQNQVAALTTALAAQTTELAEANAKRSLSISGPQISGPIRLPNLRRVDGTLMVMNAPNVTAIDLPSLVTSGLISIESNAGLAVINLPQFAAVLSGDFTVQNNAKLTGLYLSSVLSPTGSWNIMYNARLSALVLDSLTSPSGRWSILSGALTELNLPNLVSTQSTWQLSGNGLQALRMPRFTYLTDIFKINEPSLDVLQWPLQTTPADSVVQIVARLPGVFAFEELTVSGDLDIECRNCSMYFPKLRYAQSLNLNCPGVFEAPELEDCDDLKLQRVSGLSLPRLVSVRHRNYSGDWYGFAVSGSTQLKAFALPRLQFVHYLMMSANTALVSASFPSLERATTVTFNDHYVLANLSVPSLAFASRDVSFQRNAMLCVNRTFWTSLPGGASFAAAGNLCN